MARQSINVNPGLKEFEAYMDFSGGMNTEISNERLLDNEFIVMENVVLNSRGSVKKRHGRSIAATLNIPTGKVQGMMFYTRPDETVTEPDLIFAVGGKLYARNYDATITVQIVLNGSASNTFQNTRNVEMVQYYNDVYVASGSGLIRIQFDEQLELFTATSVVAYEPTAQEIKSIGLNALYPNGMTTTNDPNITSPNDFYIKGILFRQFIDLYNYKILSSAVVNQSVILTPYYYYNSALFSTIETTWHYKKSDSEAWINTSANFTFNEEGFYDFRLTAKFNLVAGGHVQKEFIFTSFESLPVALTIKPYEGEGGTINNCNRIILHYNRLMLYGDTEQPAQLYVSHIGNFGYFPTNLFFRFDVGRFEPIVSVVRIQSYLVVFSRTMIHTITGIDPTEYSVNMINDSIGCIAERSAVLTGNVITFLSNEGVFILRPTTFRLDQLNVQRIDTKIKDQMPKDTNACALNFDSQYWLCFPDKSVIYRFYYEQGVWVKDVSDNLNFVQMLQYSGKAYDLSDDIRLYQHDKTVYKDGSIEYDMIIETKYFDLSKSFNFKKLRRLYMLGRCYKDYDAEFSVSVYADSAIVLDPETGQAIVNAQDYVVWQTTLTSNNVFEHGTNFGIWELGEDKFGQEYLNVQKTRIRGKCRRVKLRFLNKQDKEVELFGFGLEFKVKKP